MWGLAYQALYRFFVTLSTPLNKNEKTQPPPLDVQRATLLRELENIDAQIAKRNAKSHAEL